MFNSKLSAVFFLCVVKMIKCLISTNRFLDVLKLRFRDSRRVSAWTRTRFICVTEGLTGEQSRNLKLPPKTGSAGSPPELRRCSFSPRGNSSFCSEGKIPSILRIPQTVPVSHRRSWNHFIKRRRKRLTEIRGWSQLQKLNEIKLEWKQNPKAETLLLQRRRVS